MTPPGTCICGGDSSVVDGAHVLVPGGEPPANHRRRGDKALCTALAWPYWLRRRKCLSCGEQWSTVELRLEDVSRHFVTCPPSGSGY